MKTCKIAFLLLLPLLSPVLAYDARPTPHVDVRASFELSSVPSIDFEPGKPALDAWLQALVQKESSGKANITIVDVNNRLSHGCLQFQEATLRMYATRYGLIEPGADIQPFFHDCEFQKELARRMILEDYDNWRHWYHSVITRGLGLPPKS